MAFLLNRVGRDIGRAFETALAAYDIQPTHFGVLNALAAAGPAHLRLLGRTLGINRQTVVNVAAELERRGLVARHTTPADRRAHQLALTPAGEAFVTRVDRAAVELERRVLGVLTPREQRTVYGALRRLAESGTLDADAEHL